ncbi:MAG: sugar transferase [Sphingobacteriales bacterium]|nr:MAG: sugar transferase [Sphingobacteriales bacterium]
MYRNFFKRLIDFVVAFFALTVALPFILIIAAILFVANDGKPFFFQPRPGKKERIFKVIKFKTMNDRKDKNGELLPDSERLTAIGSFVRRTSLDEIPQLINVLKGDMSLIGPRPLLVEYLPLYNDRQRRRHDVMPGMTGWAQINGRNAISWEQKFEYDIWYVDNISLKTDLQIILMSVKKVLFSEDINSATSATMEKFKGTPTQQI